MPETITVDSGILNHEISIIADHHGPIDPNVFESVFAALKTKRTLAFEYRPLQKTTYMARTKGDRGEVKQAKKMKLNNIALDRGSYP
jgi:hypothetical protein